MIRLSHFFPRHSKALLPDERGLTTVEYVIILVVVATLSIGTWSKFRGALTDQITTQGGHITDLEKN